MSTDDNLINLDEARRRTVKGEMRRALELLFVPGDVIELRIPHATRYGGTVSGYFSFEEREKLINAAMEYDGKVPGIYITINEINQALLGRACNKVKDLRKDDRTTADHDVSRRRWLYLDFDPARPAGISSNDIEHNAAIETADRCQAWLTEQGWPEPVSADSGNGAHKLYKIDLPNDEAGKNLIETCLKVLSERFSGEVLIDEKVYNASRIIKLYGSRACKGENLPDRPHRRSFLSGIPEQLQIVSQYQLEQLAAMLSDSKRLNQSPKAKSAASFTDRPHRTGFDLERWIAEHLPDAKEPSPWKDGAYIWKLHICPFNPEHKNTASITQLPNGAIGFNCFHNSCQQYDWHSLRDLLEPAWRERHSQTIRRKSNADDYKSNDTETFEPELADLIARLRELKPADGSAPDRKTVKECAIELVESAALLSRTEILKLEGILEEFGLGVEWIRKWHSAVRNATKRHQMLPNEEQNSGRPPYGPYDVQEGRIVHLIFSTTALGVVSEAIPVADFDAKIVEEAVTEEGYRIFIIAGKSVRGGDFRVEIPARDFSDDRMLKAAMEAAVGAQDPVRAGMAKHLGPAIKLLTGNGLRRTHRRNRTGWDDDHFLIPGRESDNETITLPSQLPYYIDPNANLEQGLKALDALLLSLTPERTTVVAATAFQAPLALLAGWRDERYAIFIKGGTGSLKTSFCQTLMCIYGIGFLSDAALIKWGEGITRNAIMALATNAHDMPFLLDNYKPSTGYGERDFINLIHNIIEGGEKLRLNRDAELRKNKPIFAWPISTGEDVPDKDPASLARILVVPFYWEKGKDNSHLYEAHDLAHHLSAIGKVWLDWLESEEGAKEARQAAALFNKQRAQWAAFLQKKRPDMVNTLRVSSNLASNQFTWAVLKSHPILGEIACRYENAHKKGLLAIANDMACYTAEALEATRFLAALRELIAAKRVLLLAVGNEPQFEDRDRTVGWLDEDGSAYLLPELVRQSVERLLAPTGLGGVSNVTLYSQLESLGFIASREKGRNTSLLWIGRRRERVLHLTAKALQETAEE